LPSLAAQPRDGEQDGGVNEGYPERNAVNPGKIRCLNKIQAAVLGIPQKAPRERAEQQDPQELGTGPEYRHKKQQPHRPPDKRNQSGKQGGKEGHVCRQQDQQGDTGMKRQVAVCFQGVRHPVNQ